MYWQYPEGVTSINLRSIGSHQRFASAARATKSPRFVNEHCTSTIIRCLPNECDADDAAHYRCVTTTTSTINDNTPDVSEW